MKHTGFAIGVVVMTLAWIGCARQDDHGHSHGGSHGHPHHAQEEHGHGGAGHGDHGHHGSEHASESVTKWGTQTQLFVEFPSLVTGEDSPFAAHLTRLSDHLALDSGLVTVELSGGNQPAEKFSVQGSTSPGIFRPVVRPAHAGFRTVTLRLESEHASETHTVGTFMVYASRAEADAAAPHEEGADGQISYLLEQQWQVPFGLANAYTRTMRPSVPAFAHIEQPHEAEVTIVAPRDGRVLTKGTSNVSLGAKVRAGDTLFRLTTTPQEGGDPATLDLVVERARIQVDAAKREVDRLAPLVRQGIVPRKRLDAAMSALATSQAEAKSARRRRASLTQTQRVKGTQDALAVPTPISGVVAKVLVAPGSWVSKGDPLARIVDRSTLVLSVGVPEAYVERLGQVSGAWFPYKGETLDVSADALLSVGTRFDTSTRTLPVRFRLDNAKSQLFAGMKTLAHLITDVPRNVVAVPLSAVVDDGGTDVVYVQVGGETFERRPVQLGIRDGANVEIVSGVTAGEWVVSKGAYTVKLASTSTASIGHGHAH